MDPDPDKSDRAVVQPILSHLNELYCFSKLCKTPYERLRASDPAQAVASALLFIWRGFEGIVGDAILSPSTWALDPVQAASVVLFYIPFGAVILLLSLGFALARVGGYGDSLIDWIGNRYAGGYSIVNWPNPKIFDELTSSVEESQEYLDGSVATTTHQDWPLEPGAVYRESVIVRTVSLPLARALLAMCALVYERKDTLVVQAKEVAMTAHEAFGDKNEAFIKEIEGAAEMLVLSETTIREQAEKWGLAFEGVSDLSSVAGEFAGLFYSPAGSLNPYIVLTIKGTGPTAFSEWLTDCTLDRTSAGSVYGAGGAHTGFFESLFKSPNRDYEGTGYGKSQTIVRAVLQVAAALKDAAVGVNGDQDLKVQLFVTGHSLGGALAELAYMRFLSSPGDLGRDVELKDCYTFGAPRAGDGALANVYENLSLTPLDRPNILWRVKNGLDIVPRVPLGIADDEDVRDALSATHVLNYAHLGPAVRLHPHRKAVFGDPAFTVEWLGRFKGTAQSASSRRAAPPSRADTPQPASAFDGTVPLVRDAVKSAVRATDYAVYRFVAERGTDPLKWAFTAFEAVLPCVWNHFPASYLSSLGLPPSAAPASAPTEQPLSAKGLQRMTAAPAPLDSSGGRMAALPGPGTGSSGGFGLQARSEKPKQEEGEEGKIKPEEGTEAEGGEEAEEGKGAAGGWA